MRSQLPYLYRSLERSGPAKGYDAIATAATLNYVSIHNPSKRQQDAYTRLLEPVWLHLGEDTRAHIAERLSSHHTVPSGVGMLLRGETLGSDASSPASEATPAPAAPHSIDDHALLADRRVPGETPRCAARSAEDARATLRSLVAAPAKPKPRKCPIIQIAQSRDRAALAAYLAENLSHPLADCEALLEPDNLPELAGALKALQLSTADAMTVLIFVDETIRTNVATFAIAKNHYEQLSPAAVAARFGQPERPVHPAPSLQPTSADLLTPMRSAGPRRAAFGRRGENQNHRTGTCN